MQNQLIEEAVLGESVLVARAADGDKSAMAAIVRKYEKRVYGLAYKYSGKHEDAEEILQETFIKALKNLPRFKGESSFSTWIYRIAVNQALDITAKRKNFLLPLDEDIHQNSITDWTEQPEALALLKEKNLLLERLIKDLPSQLRLAFLLREGEGLSYEAIGEILDLKVNTAKIRVHRARLLLRQKLSDYLKENV